MALPFFTASFRSASSDDKELLIRSKAAEEGNASKELALEFTWTNRGDNGSRRRAKKITILERHGGMAMSSVFGGS